jgi:hypothetical protein
MNILRASSQALSSNGHLRAHGTTEHPTEAGPAPGGGRLADSPPGPGAAGGLVCDYPAGVSSRLATGPRSPLPAGTSRRDRPPGESPHRLLPAAPGASVQLPGASASRAHGMQLLQARRAGISRQRPARRGGLPIAGTPPPWQHHSVTKLAARKASLKPTST